MPWIRNEDGIAVFTVMLAILFLSAIAAALANSALSDRRIVRFDGERVLDRAIYEASLIRAVSGMLERHPQKKWDVNNVVHEFVFNEQTYEIKVGPESGKVDLNTASTQSMTLYLVERGADRDLAEALTDAIADWRDEDDLVRLNGAEKSDYLNAGLDYGPRNKTFQTISELNRVLGFNPAVVSCLTSGLTLYSRRRDVDMRFAAWRVGSAQEPSLDEQGVEVVKTKLHSSPGQSYYIQVRKQGQETPPLIEVILRLTGDTRNPFTILDWRNEHALFEGGVLDNQAPRQKCFD